MINQIKTIGLLAVLTAGLVGLGALLGPTWMSLAIGLAIALNIGSYFFSDRIVLRMHNAVPMEREQYPELTAITEELAQKAGIPTPRLYLIPAHYPNAFATGRNPNHGVVAITEGLIHLLTTRELRGVLAHEIAHIRNRDVLIATIASVFAAAITYLVNIFQFSALFGNSEDEDAPSPLAGLAFALVAPFGAGLIQMAISRAREYIADAFAAEISGDPRALASTLQKLSGASATVYEEPSAATASLYIVNPLHGGMANWFSTHPPAEERVKRLIAMVPASSATTRRFDQAWQLRSQRSDRTSWPQGI